jgi:general secretion pathway protein G
MKRTSERGMTLVEIMVVLVILALMSATVAVKVVDHLKHAKVDVARGEARTLASALKLYYARTGHFPDAATGLLALESTHVIERLRPDPWGNPYHLNFRSGDPVVVSYGEDGAPGGEGFDADISSAD